VFVLTFVML